MMGRESFFLVFGALLLLRGLCVRLGFPVRTAMHITKIFFILYTGKLLAAKVIDLRPLQVQYDTLKPSNMGHTFQLLILCCLLDIYNNTVMLLLFS